MQHSPFNPIFQTYSRQTIKIYIILFLCFTLCLHCIHSKQKTDHSIQSLDLPYFIGEYWSKDSLSTNGFRAFISIEIANHKEYFIGKSESDIRKLFEKPHIVGKLEGKLIMQYMVVKSESSGDDSYLVFDLGEKSRKVIRVYRYHSDG